MAQGDSLLVPETNLITRLKLETTVEVEICNSRMLVFNLLDAFGAKKVDFEKNIRKCDETCYLGFSDKFFNLLKFEKR